jgi:eukaryotic-like serine/threonine-protein kinase
MRSDSSTPEGGVARDHATTITLAATNESPLERRTTAPAAVTGDRVTLVDPAPEDAGAPLPLPAARYQIQEIIGVGGMGEVRLCRDEAIGRDVAHKSLLGDRGASPAATRRFLREARVQGQLEHPSIVPVYDLGAAADGRLFFTMRRVLGYTLEAVIRALARGDAAMAEGFSRRKLLEAFVRVCLAVDYAHARGVLHRDLKPSNVMLGDFGEVYVIDWGVAKLVAERATAAPVVVSGALEGGGRGHKVGTLGYMAPEQILGMDGSQDARTDVYALGAILFEILTLRRLHAGATPEEVHLSTTRRPLRSPFDGVEGVPPELAALCERATAVDRAERCAGARELASAVERYLDGDRDVERRRALAVDRTAAASAALARAASDADAGAARADAVREVTAALAHDPENEEARRILVRLFVEVPSRLPPEVEAEIEAATQRDRTQYMRFGLYGVASWLMMPPLVIAMGVRAWAPVLFTTALCVVALVYTALVFRSGRLTAPRMHAFTALILATIASSSCFMGPFVVVPPIAAAVTLYITLLHRAARQRWVVIAMGSLAVAVPFLLELAGIFPPAFAFSDGNVTLFGRALRLAPETTLPLLLYAGVTSVIVPAAVLGLVRDALSSAERHLFLQAWHLRQLLRE